MFETTVWIQFGKSLQRAKRSVQNYEWETGKFYTLFSIHLYTKAFCLAPTNRCFERTLNCFQTIVCLNLIPKRKLLCSVNGDFAHKFSYSPHLPWIQIPITKYRKKRQQKAAPRKFHTEQWIITRMNTRDGTVNMAT